MLDKDVSTAHKANGTGNWPVVLLVNFKGLRTWALFTAFQLLYDLPILLLVFLQFFGASLFFLALQRPWSGSKQLRGRQVPYFAVCKAHLMLKWIRISIYALLLATSSILWNFGLKYYGPIRTIISSDYADITMYHVLGALTATASMESKKGQGAILIILSCVLLFFFGETPQLNNGYYNETEYIGPFDAGKVGGIALFAAIGLTFFRKDITRRIYSDIGGTKRLFALSMGAATCIMFPLGMYQLFTEPVNIDSSVLFSVLMVILLTIVADYYVDSIAAHQLDASVSTQSTIAAGFIVGWVLMWKYDLSGAGWFEWMCFLLTIGGINMLLGKTAETMLPIYNPNGSAAYPVSSGGPGIRYILSILKTVVKQILEKSTSRRIFELMYGIWTNSLGLITDAFHMLFDCTALFIALFAEVISQWEGNNVFSYGYGRVQVLSGFANGIFLVFISFYVLMESIERFVEPPDVKTDRLLLVSFLGFVVSIHVIHRFEVP